MNCWAVVMFVCSNGTSAPFLLGLESVAVVVVGGGVARVGAGAGAVVAFAAEPEHAICCLGCIDECLACWIEAAIE